MRTYTRAEYGSFKKNNAIVPYYRVIYKVYKNHYLLIVETLLLIIIIIPTNPVPFYLGSAIISAFSWSVI